jgi:hypothetical protein
MISNIFDEQTLSMSLFFLDCCAAVVDDALFPVLADEVPEEFEEFNVVKDVLAVVVVVDDVEFEPTI